MYSAEDYLCVTDGEISELRWHHRGNNNSYFSGQIMKIITHLSSETQFEKTTVSTLSIETL